MTRTCLIPLVSILLILAQGCVSTRMTIYETGSDNASRIEEQWVSDNDTVVVRYSFWAEKGLISFAIFNKTDRRIFVDWKNSALVVNDQKIDYWQDETHYQSVSRQRGHGSTSSTTQAPTTFDWAWITRSAGIQLGTSLTSGTMVRNERITSIPPQSFIGLERFTILGERIDPASFKHEVNEVPNVNQPKRKESILVATFGKANSPVRFRNFLSFSFHEDMREAFLVDDSFWLSSISDMAYTHYRGKYLGKDSDGAPSYEKPYKKRTSFYWKY